MPISRNINVNTRISITRVDQLEILADTRGVRPSDVLRDALYDYLDAHKVTPPSGEQL